MSVSKVKHRGKRQIASFQQTHYGSERHPLPSELILAPVNYLLAVPQVDQAETLQAQGRVVMFTWASSPSRYSRSLSVILAISPFQEGRSGGGGNLLLVRWGAISGAFRRCRCGRTPPPTEGARGLRTTKPTPPLRCCSGSLSTPIPSGPN